MVFSAGTASYAQQDAEALRKARQKELEAQRAEQKRLLDSTQSARQHIIDSTMAARQAESDRLRKIREQRADSLEKIRKYKESRRYSDSVAKVKQARLDSIQAVRKAFTDSAVASRKRISDSTIAVRKAFTDSIKAVQKKRSDSLGKIRDYRQSKRYRDSVEVVRKLRSDSIKSVRQQYYDSVASARKKVTDSITAARKAHTDSVTAVRKQYTDSVMASRKAKTDSLAKIKEKRAKDQKVKEKQKEEKAQLALELKIKKKQEAYNNEQMLKKRWGFPRSVMQNMFTRYNYYFNADQKMDEALDNMQRFRKENYDSVLALYPFNPDRDSTVLAPDMDSIIHKASLGIQIHDPRTKWGDDLYLLLGQAYYYKGDYKNAGDAFKYVVSLRDKKKKKKGKKPKSSSVVVEEKRGISGLLSHRSVHNEAILWLSRVYTQQHKEGEAESVLDLVETDPNFSGSLAGRVALEKSFIRLNQGDYKGAIQPLSEVTQDKKLPDWIRIRAAYINGQLQQRYGDYTASAASFKLVQDLNPKVDMDFYAKRNMATSLMLAGGAQEDAVAILRSILKDGKYSQYYEQVYYLLGRLSVNGGDQEGAIAYLQKGINSPKSTTVQKAMSYATLGDIYYDQKKYEYAKSSYDSSAVYIGESAVNDQVQTALRRSVVLEKLTIPLRSIRENDSLLALAEMDEKSQRAVVRRYIKTLEDRRADSIFQAENAGLTSAMKNVDNENGGKKSNYVNWYFSNGPQMQKGYNDFKQKWGSRPLADNWRRSAAGNFAQNDGKNADGADGDQDANGLPTEESLMAAIPKTKAEKDSLHLANRRAFMAGTNAYVSDLEDYPPAIIMLDTLDSRYPKHEFLAEAVYLRYIIALRQNRLDDAKRYSAQLQQQHGDSKWAKLAQPTEDGSGVTNAAGGVIAFYDEAYSLLQQSRYDTALIMAKEGQRKYPVPVYKDRFQIIEATAQAMLANYPAADSVLTVFMKTHADPNDSLKRWADAVLKYVAEQRKLIPPPVQAVDTSAKFAMGQQGKTTVPAAGGSNTPKAPQPGTSGQVVAVPGALPVNSTEPANYSFNTSEEHFVLFAFKAMEQRTKGVQVAIEDFNKFKFGSLQLQTDITMLNSSEGMITVRKFANKNQAFLYLNSLKKTKQIFREYEAVEYDVIMISVSNFDKLSVNRNLADYIKYYKSKY